MYGTCNDINNVLLSLIKTINNWIHVDKITQNKTVILYFTSVDIGHSTLVGQRPMKLLSPVCPFFCPSLTFLKIGSIDFSVYDDT